jgi:hypothetical protein
MPEDSDELIVRLQALVQDLSRLQRDLQTDIEVVERLIERLQADPENEHSELRVIAEAVDYRLRVALRARRAARDVASLAQASSDSEQTQGIESWFASRYLRHSRQAEAPSIAPPALYLRDIVELADAFNEDAIYVAFGYSYLSHIRPGEAEQVWIAVRRLLRLAGYEVLVEGREEAGSLRKRWALSATKRGSKKLVEGTLAAANDTYLRQPGSVATRNLMEGVAALMTAQGDLEGVHHFDNVITGKIRGRDGVLRVISKELSLAQRRALDGNPSLLDNPADLLARLSEIDPDDDRPVAIERLALPAAERDDPNPPPTDGTGPH